MSQSPERAGTGGEVRYRSAMARMLEMLSAGLSWSGRERDCCFLNIGTGTFADVSAIAGWDDPGDGRAVGVVDWNLDGRLDLWLTSRTAPRVRFFQNTAGAKHHWLAVRLEGNGTTTNRDAIGARVEIQIRSSEFGAQHLSPDSALRTPHSALVKTLRAGEGFLSQSSKWLHFGLGSAQSIERLIVHWPGGESESFDNLLVDQRYVIGQGTGEARAWTPPRDAVEVASSELVGPGVSDRARVVLAASVPLPQLKYLTARGEEQTLAASDQPLLVNLWSQSCRPCITELREFVAHEAALRKAGLQMIALNVDEAESSDAAATMLEGMDWGFAYGFATPQLVGILNHLQRGVVRRKRPLPVPTSFLVNSAGELAAIYKGPVGVQELLDDLQRLGDSSNEFQPAAVPFAGWWRQRPNVGYLNRDALVDEFTQAGFPHIAQTYLWQLTEVASDSTATKQALANRFTKLSEAFFQVSNVSAATDALRHAVKLNPHNAEAQFNLGLMLRKSGELDKALSHFQAAVDSNPYYPRAVLFLGLTLKKQNRLTEAAGHFRRAIEIDPEEFDAHFHLGITLVKLGKHREAVPHYQTSVKLRPNYPMARVNLAHALATLDARPAAIHQLREALRMQPNLAQAHAMLAKALAAEGQFDEAAKHQRRMTELRTSNPAPPDQP